MKCSRGIEVAGLQETRWFGQETYSVGDSVVLSSGHSLPPEGESLHRGEGVAVVLRGRALKAWKAGGARWRPISSRLAVAQLRMISERKKPFSLHVLVCYAPTFHSSRSAKDNFFNDLQAVLSNLNSNRNDHFVLLGDFNARVGSRPDVWNDADTDGTMCAALAALER